MRPPIELMKTIRPRAARIERQHRLGDGDLAGQVDLDLAAEVVDRHRLQRAGQADAGVVDEAVEAGRPTRRRSAPRRRRSARRR